MRITHTESVLLLCEVTVSEQSLIQQIITTVEENYFTVICNQNDYPINDTMADLLMHPQNNYREIMPQEFLEIKYMVKKTIYHLWKHTASVF